METKKSWKRIAAFILIAYACLAFLVYAATGFPDASCGCPVKVTVFVSVIVSPALIVIAGVLMRLDKKEG